MKTTLSLGLLMICAPLMAHHGTSNYATNTQAIMLSVLEAIGECTTMAGYGAPGRDRMTAASGATIGEMVSGEAPGGERDRAPMPESVIRQA